MMPLPRSAALTLAAVCLSAAASASTGSSRAPSQTAPGPPRVRMALVGAWHVHTGGFLNRISQMNAGQVEWVAVWDRDAVRGKQFADRLGVPYEPEYQRILDNPAVDAVMIEAETNLHADLIIRAARARKHVFTDKILTPRVEDALRIKDAIERSGVKFVISHESMPVGSYQYARKLVHDGSLGEIVSVHFRRAHGMAKGNSLPASWWDPAVAGGGALIDLGVHGMGLLTYLAGEPVRVTADMRSRTKRAVEDTATIMVDFENGAIGTAHTDMVTNIQENLLEVVGTDGCLVVVGTEGRETVYLNSRHIPERAKGMTVVTPSEYASDGKYPINKFIDFVRDRSNTAQYLDGTGLDMDTALRIVAISEAAYESARNGGRPQNVRAGATAAPPEGFLRADGTRIVDGQGREVLLRGMGLGGWMLQEGYMLGVKKDGTQHSIKARIADLVGKEDTEEFYRLWRQNHMTRADVDRLAASGFNSIRLPMHYNLFTLPIEEEPVKGRDTWLRTGFELTDNLLAWCRANRMYLILDLHAAPGGQGKDANISDYDPARPSLWESEENRRKTVALWRKLAERYANDPWLGGYDILNEPNWTFEGKDKNGREDVSNQSIWDLYKAITRAIREVDTKHLVIVEGNGWGNNYSGFPVPLGLQPRDELPQVLEPEHRAGDRAIPGPARAAPPADLAGRKRREHQRVVPRVRRPRRAARDRLGLVALQEAQQPEVHPDGHAARRLQEGRRLLERRGRTSVARGSTARALRTRREPEDGELPLQRRRGSGADSGRERRRRRHAGSSDTGRPADRGQVPGHRHLPAVGRRRSGRAGEGGRGRPDRHPLPPSAARPGTARR